MNKLPLDAVKQCSHDNWGMPGQERPPFRSNYDELMEKCSASFAVETDIVETLQDAMINFYPSTAAFSSFTGEDWVPENHNLFPSTSPWRAMKPNEEKRGKMKGTTCDTAMDDGSVWSITRIGPIITTGCYDWAQVGWNNIFDFKEKLLKHPEGIFIYEQFSGPVTRTGEVLSHPPIHVHHIHVDLMNDAGIRQRVDPLRCLRDPVDGCYDTRRVMEHHGDYECRDEDGGLNCFLESVPDGYGKFITTPLQIEGDMNDVRACNSEPFAYYYQIGAHWRPKVAADGTVSDLKPMNFYNFLGPGNLNPSDQSTLIFTFQVPTRVDSVYWYSGRMRFGGQMLRNKMHVHNKVFKEYILVKATPSELGLTQENRLIPEVPYKPIPLPDTGFDTLDALKAFILKNLENSGKKFDAYTSTELEKISQNYFNSDLFSRDRPEAICQSVQDLIEVEGYFYDRKSPTCCVPWHVKEGDIYTVVGFSPKLEYKLGPHSDAFPETFPAHVSMWMSWANEAEPPVSEYGILWHNQQPSGSLNPFGVSNQLKMATILNKGAIRNYNDIFHDYFIPASILGVIVSYPMASAAFGLLLFTLFALRCYKCLLKRYNMEDQIPMPAAAHKRTNNNSRDVEGGENICPDPDDVLRKVTEKVTSVADSENVRALKVK